MQVVIVAACISYVCCTAQFLFAINLCQICIFVPMCCQLYFRKQQPIKGKFLTTNHTKVYSRSLYVCNQKFIFNCGYMPIMISANNSWPFHTYTQFCAIIGEVSFSDLDVPYIRLLRVISICEYTHSICLLYTSPSPRDS